MRTMNDWKRTGLRSYYGKQVHEAVMAANATKQQLWEAELVVSSRGSCYCACGYEAWARVMSSVLNISMSSQPYGRSLWAPKRR
jgi:hypothetical protein